MKRALPPCEKWVFRGFSRHANGLYGPEMDMGAGGGGGGVMERLRMISNTVQASLLLLGFTIAAFR